MAKKACAGVIEIGSTPTVIGDLRSYDTTSEASEIDTTVMGTCKTRMQPGPVSNSLEAGLFFEHADAGQLEAISRLYDGAVVPVALYPEGKGAGLPGYTGNGYVMSFNVSGTAEGAIEATLTMSSDENGFNWADQGP